MRINTGDTAWVLMAPRWCMFMTPGLALFYGGMVRAKNVLAMLMQNFFCLGLVSVLWAVVHVLARVPRDRQVDRQPRPRVDATTRNTVPADGLRQLPIPPLSFSAFQLMFAIITPALITGAIADRMKFSAWFWFLGLWALLVYTPVAHWVFSPAGWLFRRGALDFAGGTVVHINAGIAALVAVHRARPAARLAATTRCRRTRCRSRCSAPASCGSAGSASTPARRSAANGIAAQAFVNTQHGGGRRDARAGCCSSASGAGTPPRSAPRRARSPGWSRSRRARASSAAMAPIYIGLIAGAICYFAVSMKFKLRLRRLARRRRRAPRRRDRRLAAPRASSPTAPSTRRSCTRACSSSGGWELHGRPARSRSSPRSLWSFVADVRDREGAAAGDPRRRSGCRRRTRRPGSTSRSTPRSGTHSSGSDASPRRPRCAMMET